MIPVAVTFFLKPLLTAKWRLGTIFLALFFTWLRLLSKCSPISYYGLKWKGRPQCCYDYGFPFFLAMALSSCSKTIVHSRHERVSCIETKLGGRVHILQLLEECWWCSLSPLYYYLQLESIYSFRGSGTTTTSRLSALQYECIEHTSNVIPVLLKRSASDILCVRV